MVRRVNFSVTTYEQRVRLFTIWTVTGNTVTACRQTGISRGTFYYWKERFLAEGYAGLQNKTPRPPRRCHTPVNLQENPPAVHAEIIAVKKQFPQWNNARIAVAVQEVFPAHDEINPSLVRNVLLQAGFWGM